MKRFFANLFGKGTQAAKSASGSTTRLEMDSLEERVVLSANLSAGGVLDITQTTGNDYAEVEYFGRDWVRVNDNGQYSYFSKWQVQRINYFGSEGNDYFVNNTGIRCRADGFHGNDTLVGGSGEDTLIGGGHNDRLYGGNGKDYLDGQGGSDYIRGGYHDDILKGGSGSDWLYGDQGEDQLYGHSGTDWLYGGSGNDYLDGGYDGVRDYLRGESGADRFKAENYFYWGWHNRDNPVDFKSWEGDKIV